MPLELSLYLYDLSGSTQITACLFLAQTTLQVIIFMVDNRASLLQGVFVAWLLICFDVDLCQNVPLLARYFKTIWHFVLILICNGVHVSFLFDPILIS